MTNSFDDESRDTQAVKPSPTPDHPQAERDAGRGDTETRSLATAAVRSLDLELETSLARIGRYRIERELGKGAFGCVYAAFDESLKRTVAIKTLMRFSKESDLKAWLAEARTLASLDHVAIVPVYDVGRTETGIPYIVSKFIGGGSLSMRLRTEPPTIPQAVRITIAMAQALGYAHERRLVHRDVKPANILMTPEGSPILADFGLALHETGLGKGPRFVGTPAYMSPEQARSESHRVDGRSDIFSLGAVLYEMLTGHRVFAADQREELLDCIRTMEVRPPRQWNRQISRELDRICLKALAKRPSDRYSTAFDFAEELQQCLVELEANSRTASPIAAEVAVIGDSHRERSSHGSRSQQPAVVPRGLRSFDAADADFFPFLLPGPRDREGLPESIRFWRNRVAQQDPDETFRVGVLLGPSGSGKSSLIRAGVLPHLPPQVVTLIADSRPEHLGVHLLKRLVYLFPKLSNVASLHEAFTALRQGSVLEPDQKFLLVLDQFEQWLNRPATLPEDGLLEALRQCDGVQVQALLIARDDFTVPLTRFMDDLEEPLRQNQNFATVDRFGHEHARLVLTAFGRAYGLFSETPSGEQQKFIKLAVEELAADGQLVPVRLALFADIVKDRPWDVNTLRQLGGARGVGIKFLEERVAGPGANPAIRSRIDLIKKLLIALLPAGEEQIKPPARTLTELRNAVGELADRDSLEESLALLDTELRLVTPRASALESSVDSASTESSREPSYQLTHDFLVPSIRAWLESEERMTREGRAKLRLRHLADAWSARPETRRLPTMGEWFAIRLSTDRRDWSFQEAKLMQATARRFVRRAGIAISVVAILAFIGNQVFSSWHAGMLSDRLVNADTAEVGDILEQMRPYARWTKPRLQVLAERFKPGDSNEDDRARRRRLNLCLALADADPKFLAETIDRLPAVPVEHLAYVRNRLAQQADQVRPLLQPRFEAELQASRDSALALGAVLIGQVTDYDYFRAYASPLAKLLAETRAVYLADWANLYQPLAPTLLPELLRLYELEADAASPSRTNLVELISAYSKDDPAGLLAALKHSLPDEIPVLLAHPPDDMLAFRGRLQAALESFGRNATAKESAPSDLPAIPENLNREMERLSGWLDADCGWVPNIPHGEFGRLNKELAALGFSVRALRPLASGDAWAVVWRRDQTESVVESGLTIDQARSREEQLRADGWELVDFAFREDSESDDSVEWTLVWQKTSPQPDVVRVYLDRSGEEPSVDVEWSEAGYAMMRSDVRVDAQGKALYSAIWRKVADGDVRAESKWRMAQAFGDLRPGKLQSDLRSHSIAAAPDRLAISETYLGHWETLSDYQSSSGDKTDGAVSASDVQRIYAARALSELGDSAAAESLLAEVVKRRPNAAEIRETMGLIYARAGKLDELRGEIAVYKQFKNTGKPESLAFLRLWEAVLDNDAAAVRTELQTLEHKKNDQREYRVRYTRALAIVAGASDLGELAEESARNLVPELQAYSESHASPNLVELLSTVDFDSVRPRPEVASFLVENGFAERLHGAYFELPGFESRQLLSLPLSQHRLQAERARSDGFLPVAIDVRVPAAGKGLVASSVWQRPSRTPSEGIADAREQGNLVLASAFARDRDPLFDALRGRWGRDVRSYIIVHSATTLEPEVLVERLLQGDSPAAELAQAIVLTLGAYPWTQIPQSNQRQMEGKLQAWANSAEDSGVRAAAEWCLEQWHREILKPTSTAPASLADSSWHRNSLGQVMVTVHPNEKFLMGSPPFEPGHEPSESLHWARLERTIAVADTEVTEKHFQEFLNDPRVQSYYKRDAFKDRSRFGDGAPQRDVTWVDAARFCQWLSEREGIPKSQWCYPNAWNQATKTPPAPARDHVSLSGYRLPTEIEWEYFARAGSIDAYHFGADESLLSAFEWLGRNSAGAPRPVAMLRPNRWGIFDVLGNISEWCDDPGRGYDLPVDQPMRADLPSDSDLGKPESRERNVRGGRFSSAPSSCRCAKRSAPSWDTTSNQFGFRVVRTLATK